MTCGRRGAGSTNRGYSGLPEGLTRGYTGGRRGGCSRFHRLGHARIPASVAGLGAPPRGLGRQIPRAPPALLWWRPWGCRLAHGDESGIPVFDGRTILGEAVMAGE